MFIKERERKLLITSSEGDNISHKLKQLEKIEDFFVQDNKNFSIQDAYFDTKEFHLAGKKGYLRVRGKQSGHLLVIRTIDNDSIDEISHPCNDDGLKLVLSFLSEHFNIQKEPNWVLPHMSEIFQSVGLSEILRVATERTERNIYMEDVLIGKMKIDKFQYIHPNQIGPFYEVEMDSYKEFFHKQIDAFISTLLKEYSNTIEPSTISKYLRGVNICYGRAFQ